MKTRCCNLTESLLWSAPPAVLSPDTVSQDGAPPLSPPSSLSHRLTPRQTAQVWVLVPGSLGKVYIQCPVWRLTEVTSRTTRPTPSWPRGWTRSGSSSSRERSPGPGGGGGGGGSLRGGGWRLRALGTAGRRRGGRRWWRCRRSPGRSSSYRRVTRPSLTVPRLGPSAASPSSTSPSPPPPWPPTSSRMPTPTIITTITTTSKNCRSGSACHERVAATTTTT